MKFREFLNESDVKMRKDGYFSIKTLKHIADAKSPDYAWTKLGLFMLGKSTRFNISDEFKEHLIDVFQWFNNAYSSKSIYKFKDFMNEVAINSDLDVVQLIDNEQSAELAYIYTALFMVGKGLDFDVDEDFKCLVKQAVEGCSTAFTRVKHHDNS